MRPYRALISFAALLGLAAPAAANSYSGNLSDDTTGPIPAGVHTVAGNIALPAGKTLTIHAGAILKFMSGYYFDVVGQLLVQGASGNEVIFTSYPDDSAGGDTNGDGPSSGSWGQWCGFILKSNSGPSVIDHAVLRYAGYGGWDAITFDGTAIGLTMTNSVIESCWTDGMDLRGNLNYPTVSNCQFINSGLMAVQAAVIDSVPGFTDNSASGNGGNYLRVSNPTVQGAAVTIEARNCLNGALVLGTHCAIPAGRSLTLREGVVVKMQGGYYFDVFGALALLGTVADPVVLTSYSDDTAGGDTNNNGPSAGAPGQWSGIILKAGSGPSVLDHAEVRYGGGGGWDAVTVDGTGVGLTMTHAIVDSSLVDGLDLRGNLVYPTVTNCQFTNNAWKAVEGVCIDSVPGFSDNAAAGNGGNYLRVPDPSQAAAAVSIEARNCLNGALVFGTHCGIAAGKSLTLKEGVVVKMQGGYYFDVFGALALLGSAANPVVLTSYTDDTAAGDTNNNGPSSGSPGQWCGIVLKSNSGPSTLDHAEVRYAGSGGWDAVTFDGWGIGLAMSDTLVEQSAADGIDLRGNLNYPAVTHCQLTDNAGKAVAGLCIDTVSGFSDNSASGNGGSYMHVVNPAPAGNVVIEASNCLNGALVFATHCTVPSGTSLTLNEGVVVKMAGGYYLYVQGALNTAGTPRHPVVFTSLQDDAYAGDTNNNGASSGSPGQWCGFIYDAVAALSTVENLLIRFAGSSSYAGLESRKPTLDARRVRVESGASRGFQVSDLLYGEDWAAYACQVGIELKGGSFALKRVTAAGNSGTGIYKNGAWTGTLSSAISWGNTGANYSGIAQGQLYYSDGSAALAGLDGNINQDPLFLNLAAGDLRLAYGSPCVDTGDPADHAFSTQGMDLVSRDLDGDLDGLIEIDMGAYEYTNVRLAVTGTLTPGGTITFTSTGKPGLASYMFLAMAEGDFDFFPYGTIYLNLLGPWTFMGWAPTESLITLPVPLGLPVPLPVSFQQLALTGGGGAGNLSNPASIVIQ